PALQLSVLFIGNSYTRFNNLPRMVRKLAESTPGAPPLTTRMVAFGGHQLRTHHRRGDAMQELRASSPTHVVLQPHSLEPVRYPERLLDYAGRYARVIHARGAKPILLAPWPRPAGHHAYQEPALGGSPQQMW